ncbi:MAG: hypothetical protein QW275_03455, partial [Candidatus Anstonellaceae archaeon]
MNLMLSLFVSLLVETAVLLLVLKEQKKQLLVACSIFATTLTHSLFSLVLISKFLSIPKLFSFPLIYPLFVLSYEVFVVFAEGAIFKILLER